MSFIDRESGKKVSPLVNGNPPTRDELTAIKNIINGKYGTRFLNKELRHDHTIMIRHKPFKFAYHGTGPMRLKEGKNNWKELHLDIPARRTKITRGDPGYYKKQFNAKAFELLVYQEKIDPRIVERFLKKNDPKGTAESIIVAFEQWADRKSDGQYSGTVAALGNNRAEAAKILLL